MRRYLACFGAVLTLLIVGAATATGATRIAVGPKFGLNFTTMLGDLADTTVMGEEPDAGYVVRGMFGAFAIIALSDKWAIQPEFLYSQKAGEWEWVYDIDAVTATTTTELIEFEYIEIPVLVRFTIPQTGRFQPFFYGGPAVAFHSSSSVKLTVITNRAGVEIGYWDHYASNIYNAKSTIAEGILGAGLEWKLGNNRLILEGRYTRNLTTLLENVDDFDAVPKDDAAVAHYPSGEALDLDHSVFSIILGIAFSL